MLIRPWQGQAVQNLGFSMVELMVAIAIAGILAAAAGAAFPVWISNNRVRTVADSIQDGIRLAQTEALRRNRQTVFSLTNDNSGKNAAAVANGRNWVVHTVPLPGEDREFVRGGQLSEGQTVAVTGPAAICFNSLGRLVQNATPGSGVACTANAATPTGLRNYDIRANGATAANRALRVTVSLSGQLRLCDPAVPLTNTSPQGCPA